MKKTITEQDVSTDAISQPQFGTVEEKDVCTTWISLKLTPKEAYKLKEAVSKMGLGSAHAAHKALLMSGVDLVTGLLRRGE